MIDPGRTADREALQAEVREFARRELPRDYVRACDRDARAPLDKLRLLGPTGWLGLGLPEQHGGAGDLLDAVIVLDELAYASYALASLVGRVAVYAGHTVAQWGTAAQREALLPEIVAGRFLLSVGMTEPDTGSDATGITTRAERHGDVYIVNVEKIYSSGAAYADRILISARTDPSSHGRDGLSALLVDPRLPGVETEPMEFLGMRANPAYGVRLRDVEVPVQERLGEEHQGWAVFSSHLERERINQAAKCAGAMRAAFDDAATYAGRRHQFGRPIASFQAIQQKIADMAIDCRLAQLSTFDAAARYSAGMPCRLEAMTAKVAATEGYIRVANNALQVMGAFGYSMDSDAQRHFRDSRAGVIGAGTSEILRGAISRLITG